ncbi:MAG: hypothetical protein KAG56_06900 [Sulfurovaceae bacterium]|nr:hypothetical protein [Sulfurovaceae bacterium]
MIRNIIILILFVASALVLNHFYKPVNSLVLDENSVKFKVLDKEFSLPYQSRKNIPLHLSHIDIDRSELGVGKEKIYVELAETEALSEFTYTYKKSISMLLNAKRAISLFKSDGLEAFQIILANGQMVNLFVTQRDPTVLSFAYGFSNESFTKAIETLSGEKVELKDTFVLTKPLAQWSAENLNLHGIISSVDH